jgi:transposase
MTYQDKITIYGPKAGSVYCRIQDGRQRAACDLIPRTEASVIRHFQLCMPYGVRGISDGILIGRHETTAHRLGRGRRGGKPDGGVCPATGGHPAPRQERILSRARMTVLADHGAPLAFRSGAHSTRQPRHGRTCLSIPRESAQWPVLALGRPPEAKVEAAVLIVERWILARLRNQRFFSLTELNAAIRILVDELNARLMRKLGASRREFFESIDRPALLPLPAEPYQYAEWHRARVAPDYHVEVRRHFYSVPSRLIRQVVEVRSTEHTIEVFHRGVRVASHARSPVQHRHTTIPEHMPSAHRRYAFWTPARVLAAAERIGQSTVALCEAIMRAKPHPEQGFRSCLGILSLARAYGPARLEAACRRGISIGATSYRSIASILKNGLDKAFLAESAPEADSIHHGNIRGQGYYH